jgi:biotin carboxyl carrier protein
VNFDVAVNGRPWKVAIEPAERRGEFTVVVKGKKRVVDASWIDTDTLSLIDGSTAREVRISKRDSGALGLTIGGRVFEAVVSQRGRVPFSDPVLGKKVPDAVSGPAAVRAPMPGRVVRVLVAVGDRVTAGQGLVVVEAMKMENELRSPKDGIVKDVKAQTGTAVDAGAVLVVVE